MRTIRIGTRESRLAVEQARLLQRSLEQRGIGAELVTMKTTGDRILDRALDQVGGKGLFVKELDRALREGRCDVTVHSCKDLPMETPADLPLLGFSRREDPRDALVLPQGVDTLAFDLPPEWAGKSVALHIQQADGSLPAPLLLDELGQAAVDRRLTASLQGRWMLTATDGQGYDAYTQPGSYDTCEILPTEGDSPPPSATLYEQFVAQVLSSALSAQAASQQAAQSASDASGAVGQAAGAVTDAQAQAQAAEQAAERAEAAALRAEGAAPVEGPVISVNSKGGRVVLDAADVGALPLPATAAAGSLLRVQSVESEAGLTVEAVPEAELTGFVHRSDLPTAAQAGPIKLDSGYGLALTAGGELRLAPAGAGQLAAMTDGWSPLTPALVPLAVKLALASLWESAAWSDTDRSSARTTLGAAAAAAREARAARGEARGQADVEGTPPPVEGAFYT